MIKLFANKGDPDQMTHAVVSDLGLLCVPITLLGSLDVKGLIWLMEHSPRKEGYQVFHLLRQSGQAS